MRVPPRGPFCWDQGTGSKPRYAGYDPPVLNMGACEKNDGLCWTLNCGCWKLLPVEPPERSSGGRGASVGTAVDMDADPALDCTGLGAWASSAQPARNPPVVANVIQNLKNFLNSFMGTRLAVYQYPAIVRDGD